MLDRRRIIADSVGWGLVFLAVLASWGLHFNCEVFLGRHADTGVTPVGRSGSDVCKPL
jgi:hypothetical protein